MYYSYTISHNSLSDRIRNTLLDLYVVDGYIHCTTNLIGHSNRDPTSNTLFILHHLTQTIPYPIALRITYNISDLYVMDGYVHSGTKQSNGASESGPNSRCTVHTPPPHVINPSFNRIQDNLLDAHVMLDTFLLLRKNLVGYPNRDATLDVLFIHHQ